ncbi:MAG: chromosomal replication initiator protein DnaA [Oscillospiraceae bacterium]|jgi:chromosomal replication initiator protein|nr:chromosomal replication initiator protein DnaA [Oscillospiraceae bacterium]
MSLESDFWETVKEQMKESGLFSDIALNTWFSDCTAVALTETEFVLLSPVPYKARIVETRFAEDLSRVIGSLLPQSLKIRVLSDETVGEYREAKAASASDEDYTFEKFVVGNSNKFAYNAAKAVAEGARHYNPLFIYGNSGLGKTHLLRAIRREVFAEHPDYQIAYVTSEGFLNTFISYISAHKDMDEFRQKYRYANVFLMDDVQFLAGKVQIQEEFFHTFNALLESGSRIVLTSDRPPGEISRLEDRLVSRFVSGIMTDINPPDFETRVAIAKNKAAELGYALPNDVAVLLGEQLKSNIRLLEGAVKKIHGLIAFTGNAALGLDEVMRLIKDMIRETERTITADLIIEETASYYGRTPDDLRGKSRPKDLTRVRHVAMYLVRTMTGLTYEGIGDVFGGRDHTTVMSGISNIEEEQKASAQLRDELRDLNSNISNRANESI